MQITSRSSRYKPEAVIKRYVMHAMDGSYCFCEVGQDRRFDLRQGTVMAAELPDSVREAADARKGYWPAYVEWPL